MADNGGTGNSGDGDGTDLDERGMSKTTMQIISGIVVVGVILAVFLIIYMRRRRDANMIHNVMTAEQSLGESEAMLESQHQQAQTNNHLLKEMSEQIAVQSERIRTMSKKKKNPKKGGKGRGGYL